MVSVILDARTFWIDDVKVNIFGNVEYVFKNQGRIEKYESTDYNKLEYAISCEHVNNRIERTVEQFINKIITIYDIAFDEVSFLGKTKIIDGIVVDYPKYLIIHSDKYILYELKNKDTIQIEYICDDSYLEEIIVYIERVNPDVLNKYWEYKDWCDNSYDEADDDMEEDEEDESNINIYVDVPEILEVDIEGNMNEDVYGIMNGDIEGDMNGDFYGIMNGDIEGDMTGDIYGIMTGNIEGRMLGVISGEMSGEING